MTLIIKKLMVRDLGPIKKLDLNFVTRTDFGGKNNHDRIIVGMNGVGKTFVLNLLATLTGNDAATEILVNKKIGSVRLDVTLDGTPLVFESQGMLIREDIDKFKKLLGDSRSNYGMNEYRVDDYRHGSCDYATTLRVIKDYLISDGSQVFNTRRHTYSMMLGDGNRQAISLINLTFMGDGPLLLDEPSRHMHLVVKRKMAKMLHECKRQVIFVTHCPEMLYERNSVFSMEGT